MNYKMIGYVLGQIFKVEAAILLLSLIVSVCCGENLLLAFIIPIVLLVGISIPMTRKKPQNINLFAKEGFVIVALSWIVLSLFGALPFWISREVPSFMDAFFETVSGFTTTGATVIRDVEALSRGLLFWRSFTHWIGGMGVLVFVLAIFPEQETQSIFLMKAESPGPQVGKIVSKLKITARILYAIYVALTLLEFILLLCGGMPFFDSLVNSLATAGTGGFAIWNDGIAHYQSAYVEYVIAIFMMLFGVNFNVFYLILIKRFADALRCEEMRVYFCIIGASTLIITLNTFNIYKTFGRTFRTAFFQVCSIITTTGFSTVDFNSWPTLSKTVLVVLMLFGACAGSTAGGLKIARLILLIKSGLAELRRCISPNSVISIKFEGKPVEQSVIRSTSGYLVAYFSVMLISMLAISINGFDFESTVVSVISCFNNIGPGLGKLFESNPTFSDFSVFSKIVLSFDMIAGRLEIFPVLLLISPKTYKY
ncbi:MAG: TrkH family potassium uptake protein [Clostridiales bacterium]|nr:TrkH family potassium uptake protein [Clostridiales bacterium]